MLDEKPSENMEKIVDNLESAVKSHKNFQLNIARSFGKSSLSLIACIWAMSVGLKRYVLYVCANSKQSQQALSDMYRLVQNGEKFQQDYPLMTTPHLLCNGSFRRRQIYKGKPTAIVKNTAQIKFADIDGVQGPVIVAAGVSGGIRGARIGTQRPDLIIADDLQTDEDAVNPESVLKLYNIIKKNLLNLGGSKKSSFICLGTPICADDLCQKLKDDKHFITTSYPAIIKYPHDFYKKDGLWKTYLSMYEKELVEDLPHTDSLTFYKENFTEMNEGSEVLSPSRFSKDDGYISAIQRLLLTKRELGDVIFDSEYQMTCRKMDYALDITPAIVAKKINNCDLGIVPDGYTAVYATTDLNLASHLTTVVCAYNRDRTSSVIYTLITPSKIDAKLTDAEYNQKTYSKLTELGKKLKSLGVKIDGWGIDANGSPFDAVCDFTKNSVSLCGIKSVAMIGRNSQAFNPLTKMRLRDEINHTLLMGDAVEHAKSGAGKKYLWWDSDLYKYQVQKSFIAEVGSIGGCSISRGITDIADFAQQICSEKLIYIRHSQNGRDEYRWKQSTNNHFLDSLAMNFALVASQGISGSSIHSTDSRIERIQKLQHMRKKIRFV